MKKKNNCRIIKKYDDELFYLKKEDGNLNILKKIEYNKVKDIFGEGIVKNAYQEINCYFPSLGLLEYYGKLEYKDSEIPEEETKNMDVVFTRVHEIEKSKNKFNTVNFDITNGDVYIEFVNDKIVRVYTSEWGDIESLNEGIKNNEGDEIF